MEIKKQSRSSLQPPVFYHDKILSDDSSTVTLYYYKEKGIPEELARGAIDSNLLFQVNMEWNAGGSFMSRVAQTAASTYQGLVDVTRAGGQMALQTLSTMANKAVGTQSEFLKQSVFVGGDGVHLKYQGSNSNLAIPQANFIFINTDDSNSYLLKCSNLLRKLMPKQETLARAGSGAAWREIKNQYTDSINRMRSDIEENNTITDEDKKAALSNLNKAETKSTLSKLEASYGFIEYPPGDYRDLNTGYTMKGISGYFALKFGFKTIHYLVPSAVSIRMSSTGSNFGADRIWRPHFIYVAVQLTRAGKLFSKDLYHNLLFEENLNCETLPDKSA